MNAIVSSIISSVFKQENKLQNQNVQLRPGQVFNGKILKLFPNQTAEVQIGNIRMIAQLDIPLQVGSQYWLQVQPGDGKTLLKVIDGAEVSTGSQEGLDGVLKAFGLSSSKENSEIIQYFLKEQLPISKELIQNTANWIKSSDQLLQGLNTMKWMISEGYPISKEIFLSLSSLQSHDSITEIMRRLSDGLAGEAVRTPASNSLKELLSAFITNESNSTGEKLLNSLVKEWMQNKNGGFAFSILKKLEIIPNDMDEQTLLKRAMEPSQTPFTKDQELMGRLKNTSNHNELLANQSIVDSMIKSLGLPMSKVAILPSKLLELTKESENVEEKSLLQALMTKSETNSSILENSEQVYPFLKKLIKSLGLHYEKELFDSFKGTNQDPFKQENLKGKLIQYLAEYSDSPHKEDAEQLLQRITGMQLLSRDIGPLLQVIMQIPVPLWKNVTDLTVQWSGQKTKDGKIDPSYCRVLFYLDLENLKETIVDLKIQNRVISIKIINDNPQVMLDSKPFHHMLKENLKQMDFHLSSLLFEQPKQYQQHKKGQTILSAAYQNQTYSGVDLKV